METIFPFPFFSLLETFGENMGLRRLWLNSRHLKRAFAFALILYFPEPQQTPSLIVGLIVVFVKLILKKSE